MFFYFNEYFANKERNVDKVRMVSEVASRRKVIYVTGGTGFIGSALVEKWLALDSVNTVVIQSREPSGSREALRKSDRIRFVRSYSEVDCPIYGLVNLAGAPIADARWTPARKRLLEDSRVGLTMDLSAQVAASDFKPQVVVSASAIGVYPRGEAALDESSPVGEGYAAELCQRWEASAKRFEPASRLVVLRFGVVLGRGGMIAKLRLPFLLGLGGPIASGRQWFSWIHRQDAVALIVQSLLSADMAGVFNACAPKPVPQAHFARYFGRALSRPAVLPTPGFVLRALFGQMATELLIEGQQVLPARASAAGFEFRFSNLDEALDEICAKGSD